MLNLAGLRNHPERQARLEEVNRVFEITNSRRIANNQRPLFRNEV